MEPLLVKKRKGMREVRIVSHLVFAPQLLRLYLWRDMQSQEQPGINPRFIFSVR